MPVTIGTSGRAVTPLRPTGFVEVEGERFEAKLAPGMVVSVEAGGIVVVIGVDRFGLLVRAVGEVPRPESLTGFGTSLTSHAIPNAEDAEKRWKQERWENRVQIAFIIILAAIFPIVGGFAYGLEGLLLGFILDLGAIPFLYFFGGLLP
ncbi:NfeD family protein [Limnoglobus roseus]|uniref:NfeD-like C-terminal domain-containing protein n=1 Tax=Limnoglobus roseus TaxID=2598579 RepID=A0A5C1A5G9_9BACT|nr:hypothetical protein [Limnoglobus roseus]QEL13567.1 hypothetical protein PX52LOC_00425 [Limnoglobus roseus]